MNVVPASSASLKRSFARSSFRRFNGARFNSTSSTEKKAQDTLAGAQKAAGKAWESTVKFLGPVGERLGNLLGGESPFSFSSFFSLG